jgi:hypothetical protein
VKSCGINRIVIKTLVEAYRQTKLEGLYPVYDGRKNLFTAGELPFKSEIFTVPIADNKFQYLSILFFFVLSPSIICFYNNNAFYSFDTFFIL